MHLNKKRSPGKRKILSCQPAQCSGDQTLGPNGSELAGAASDLSRSPGETEGENNNPFFFLNQSRARLRMFERPRRGNEHSPGDGPAFERSSGQFACAGVAQL